MRLRSRNGLSSNLSRSSPTLLHRRRDSGVVEMTSSSWAQRNRRIQPAGLALAALLVTIAPATRAGEQLSVDELAARSDGAVVVHVALGATTVTKPSAITILRRLPGADPTLLASPTWFGSCLPSRKLLRRWLLQHRAWPASKRWTLAIRRGTYDAIVFLKTREATRQPYCEVEAMQMNHTSLAPQFADYERRAREAMSKRAP
jgi:hypothetical protein